MLSQPKQFEPTLDKPLADLGLLSKLTSHLRRIADPKISSIWLPRLLVGYCATAALSIALSQTFVVLALGYWLLILRFNANSASNATTAVSKNPSSEYVTFLAIPMSAYFAVSLISSCVGIEPLRSIPETIKTSFYMLIPFCVCWSLTRFDASGFNVARLRLYFAAFLSGQLIASLHTLLGEARGKELPQYIPGAVTESGQLVLIIPMALGLFALHQTKWSVNNSVFPLWNRKETLLAGALLLVSILFAWPAALVGTTYREWLGIPAGLTLAGLILGPLFLQNRNSQGLSQNASRHILISVFALICSALILNLKRGPWAGVFFELLLLGTLLSRRLFFSTILIGSLLMLCLQPARARLFNLVDDFTVGGGRQSMWSMGVELTERFPLGLGPKNARYMRELDPSLPELHRHMHNNLLNVAVESGWMGLITFLWWMYAAIKSGFSQWQKQDADAARSASPFRLVALLLGVGLLGWQIAGTVEYNFGDGEVRMIALFSMGILLALPSFKTTQFEPARTDEAVL